MFKLNDLPYGPDPVQFSAKILDAEQCSNMRVL